MPGSIILDIEKFNIRDDYAEFTTDRITGNTYLTAVYGIVTLDRDYRYLEIEIPIYDKDGNLIDKFFNCINNVRAGENWKFKAIGFRRDAASYDITKADISTEEE